MADSPSSSHSEQASTNPKFRVVGHRRFLTKGNNKYLLPADELEMDRLDYQHSIIKIVRKANFEAPVEALLRKGIKVLDVGCGSGNFNGNKSNPIQTQFLQSKHHFIGITYLLPVRAATQARDIDITFQHDLVHLLGTASLVNIQSDQVSCPIGWYGRVGELAIGNMRQLFSSMKPILSIAMGLSEREYDRIINEILDGFGKHRTWCRGLGAYGTKPYIL
ncbi:hypothetical protein BC936DRAFT_148085 [Jimgerdemannia flammicorona]|uniref:Methyltransferase type 11 domain-containing protein n=1 Tax=Jimgerdemannia flammicorona TaxID=994334 RepID=A0A433D3U0_9FUNG|nr:hypothetical protein BC936DRAFT_148085 [Jimgerdemannia flammicorona]